MRKPGCGRTLLRGLVCMLLGTAVSQALASGPVSPSPLEQWVIHAGVLIAEPGQPVRRRQSIIVEGGVIRAIEDGYVQAERVIDLSDAYVLPGLIDLHVHVTGPDRLDANDPTGWVIRRKVDSASRTALAALPMLKAILDNGFTTIRNMGDPASVTYDLRDAIARGHIAGPRMLVSETQFTTAGGDLNAGSFGLRREAEPLMENRGYCTDPDDCRRAVREEVLRGADVIKFRLGDIVALDPQMAPLERREELLAVVETAHGLKRKVAAHTGGNDAATLQAVEAGVDTVDHGPVGDEVLAAMKRRGTTFVPTLTVYEIARPLFEQLGITRDFLGEARASVRRAHRAGVPIAFGTDLMPGEVAGQAREFGQLVGAGLTPTEALRAATVVAAAALGREAQAGSIAPGKWADIVAVAKDPTQDIEAMREVIFVMKDGRVAKQPSP